MSVARVLGLLLTPKYICTFTVSFDGSLLSSAIEEVSYCVSRIHVALTCLIVRISIGERLDNPLPLRGDASFMGTNGEDLLLVRLQLRLEVIDLLAQEVSFRNAQHRSFVADDASPIASVTLRESGQFCNFDRHIILTQE